LESIEKGALYLVSTPIGNLGDITYRAVHILKNVDLIAAEDTRTSRVLLTHYQIQTPMRSYHSYNIKAETPKLIAHLTRGNSLALISDAGTPGISDPGYNLVQACTLAGLRIIPIPGASALLAALVASGLASHQFAFEGFLPLKKGRKTRIEFLKNESRTIVLYESPHRIQKTVQEICDVFGQRPCVMARELTKKFEQYFRGQLADLRNYLKANPVKGEIVLLIAGNPEKPERPKAGKKKRREIE
jgi:16S rRNA (cytidine1402-2'-O)-methyltransferase